MFLVWYNNKDREIKVLPYEKKSASPFNKGLKDSSITNKYKKDQVFVIHYGSKFVYNIYKSRCQTQLLPY